MHQGRTLYNTPPPAVISAARDFPAASRRSASPANTDSLSNQLELPRVPLRQRNEAIAQPDHVTSKSTMSSIPSADAAGFGVSHTWADAMDARGGASHPPVHVVLLTQNLGSIENNDEAVLPPNLQAMAMSWIESVNAFLQLEARRQQQPPPSDAGRDASSEAASSPAAASPPIDIVVIHLQEIGGKRFNRPLNVFLSRHLAQAFPWPGWCSGLVMPDEDDSTFTAMGSVLFVHQRIAPYCSLLSYRHRVYVSLLDDPMAFVATAASSTAATSSPSLTAKTRPFFMGAKFLNADTSRKGYLLTSLRVGCQTLNFLNVHLFHDADNSVAIKASPSDYCKKRAQAMAEAIEAISALAHPDDPLFVFGDLNTRLDGQRVVKMLEQKFSLQIGMEKKAVKCPDNVWDFFSNPASWDALHAYDTDLRYVMDHVASKHRFLLSEMPRAFPPTYLLEPEVSGKPEEDATPKKKPPGFKVHYAHERLPAWCDRVLQNAPAVAMMEASAYFTANLHPMDHLPVYVRFRASRVFR